jgi:Domain of unknown function (DUF4340)
MKKNLAPLVIVFAALLVLVAIKVSSKKETTIVQEVQLPSLLEGVSASDVAQFEVYAGAMPDEKVVLTRDADDPEVWRVTSHFNAPAKEDTIDGFVSSLMKLKGEFRATAEGDPALEEYNLTDEKAFHVKGYKAGADTAAFHVLAGEAPKPNQVFMRVAGGAEVYVLDVNLRREAGLWQDDADKAPEAGHWLDKSIAKIEKDAITKVALKTPDRAVVFERREKPAEKPEEPAEKPEEEGEDSPEEAEEPKVEYEWVLASGGPGGEYKQTGLDQLRGAFASLAASDIVDPEQKAEWGLDAPAFTCTLTVEGQEKPTVIEGGRPSGEGDGYVRVAGAAEEVIYKLGGWNFDKIFGKASDLFDLPGLGVKAEEVTRVEITQPAGSIVLAKEGEDWKVEAPAAPFDLQKNTVDTIAKTLAEWKATDYADAGAGTGLEAPTRKAAFMTKDGASHTVVLGADAKGLEGAYAKLDDGARVLVMKESDIDRVFVEPSELFELALFDIDDADIKTIEFTKDGAVTALARAEEGWTLTVAGEICEAEDDAAEDLAQAFVDLQAAEILFGVEPVLPEASQTVKCVMADGAEHTVAIGPKQDKGHQVQVSGLDMLVLVDPADVADLTPDLEALKKEPEPEPEPEAEAEAEASEEAAEPVVVEMGSESMPAEDAKPKAAGAE